MIFRMSFFPLFATILPRFSSYFLYIIPYFSPVCKKYHTFICLPDKKFYLHRPKNAIPSLFIKENSSYFLRKTKQNHVFISEKSLKKQTNLNFYPLKLLYFLLKNSKIVLLSTETALFFMKDSKIALDYMQKNSLPVRISCFLFKVLP